MDSIEYAPGTMAVVSWVEDEIVRTARAIRTETSDWSLSTAWQECLQDSAVTDVRPLVVLDLIPEQVELVCRVLREGMSGGKSVVADQIEAQTKPPRIPEPTGCGATVLASQIGEESGSERLWVRFRHGSKGCWIDQYEHVRSWDDLDNPRAQDCEGD